MQFSQLTTRAAQLQRQQQEEVQAEMPYSTSSWRSWQWKPFDAALSRSERRSQNIYIDLQLLLPVLFCCCCCFYSWNSSINCRHFIFDGHRAEMSVTYSTDSPCSPHTDTDSKTNRPQIKTDHEAASLPRPNK